jgi:hypothetical protein
MKETTFSLAAAPFFSLFLIFLLIWVCFWVILVFWAEKNVFQGGCDP